MSPISFRDGGTAQGAILEKILETKGEKENARRGRHKGRDIWRQNRCGP